jgi:Asp-tRNA(Asn)/Glu-tRNA(Gln) amidotransferase A subunit family amidase
MFKLIFCLVPCALYAAPETAGESSETNGITSADIEAAEKIIGLEFSAEKRDMMKKELNELLEKYGQLRTVQLDNSDPPAFIFNPLLPGIDPSIQPGPFRISSYTDTVLPASEEELAYYSIGQLAELLRTKKVTSEKLTRLYLARLKKYGPKLKCVITLTEDLTLKQARAADKEIQAGHYRGLLHGIPYGVKDLLATKGIRTTWGSQAHTNQVVDTTATVIERLEEAGAVMTAKLTLGALAMGDEWYGGKTRCPWDTEKGSSGSSAGSAAATAAGLVPFAIGSETHGSIISPCTQCGITGLRPTFGRISRYGAMALSWTMDKLGPICRNVEDCAIVLNVLNGPDNRDPSVQDISFSYALDIDLSSLRIGYIKSAFETNDVEKVTDSMRNNCASLDALNKLDIQLIPIELPELPINALKIILSAETSAAFDAFVREGTEDQLRMQEDYSWPNAFRKSRFIPAVEYIRANRIRYKLMQEMAELMKTIDVYVTPSFDDNLLLTNLTGHPSIVVPNGFDKDGIPTSISFTGQLYDEGRLLSVAKQYQDATGWHLKHPELREK